MFKIDVLNYYSSISLKSSPNSVSKILINSDVLIPKASAIFHNVINLQSVFALSILLKLLSFIPYSLERRLQERPILSSRIFLIICPKVFLK